MNTPTINWARPHDARVQWQAYINGSIAVRELGSGIIEIKTGDEDWREA